MAIGLDNKGFADALVILGAAGIVIPAFARLKISPVIGFILVGVLVGPAGLGRLVDDYHWLRHFTISDRAAIEPFAQFGIVLLLFAIGLELSFRRLWAMRAQVFGVGAAELIGSGLLIALPLWLIGQPWPGAIALGLGLALSSTALVLPIANAASRVGRAALAMLLFEDLALVPIVFGLATLAPGAGGSGWAIAEVLLRGLVTIVLLFIAGRLALPRLFAQAARTKSPELFLAAALLVVITASLATSAAGLSPIVGALLAGLLIAETDYRSEVEVITAPFRGLALGVFLLTVGMGLDLPQLLRHWPTLALGVGGVIVVKALVTFVLLRVSGERTPVAAETGVLMASPSETTLIVLGAAGAAGLINPSTAAFWQTVTAIGLTITPLLARLGQLAARQIEGGDAGDDPEDIIARKGPGTVILGFGRVGRMVAEMMRAHHQPFVAVDADIDVATAARHEGFPVIFGDVARGDLVDRLNLGRARALILTMDDPVLTVHLTRRVRGWVPDLTIVARARDVDHAAELYAAGVTDAVPETLESSLQLAEAVLTDLGVAAGPVIASIHDKRDLLRREIKAAAGIAREPRLRRSRVRK